MAIKQIFRKVSKNTGDEAIKLAPQEQVVFDAIPATKAGIERAELLANLQGLADEGTLKTGQKVGTILGYYKKHLVDSGLIEIERVEVETPKAEKKAA